MNIKANACIGNCLQCGKCGIFSILESFSSQTCRLEPQDGYGVAVDIGTTSVVLALLDLSTGKSISRHSFINPQKIYGSDVISRINAANNGELEALRKVIADSITLGVKTLLKSCGTKQVKEMAIAGNTVMTYLLLGLPCESLGTFPFKPAYDLDEKYNYSDVFKSSDLCFPVRIVPWFSAFVGGDVLAGLLYTLPLGKSRFMLIDLGTNGEMALYDNGSLTVTSAAAGSAFECCSHGRGASVVIDHLALLVRKGFVDETGLLSDNAPQIFTQKEIRELQLAKSAVRSGLEILLKSSGGAEPYAVYLAGGIGQKLNPESAAAVGLIPPQLKCNVQAVGNASLGGAARLLLDPSRSASEMHTLLEAASEINLATHPDFNELFMQNMYFYW